MSYNIIKSIRLDEKTKQVYINSAPNNVRPRYYTNEPAPYFARIWEEKGREAVEIALVKAFESGDFQGGSSKYKEAATRLRRMKAYADFNWRSGGLGDEYKSISNNRRERAAEFDALVLKALQEKKPTTKFVLKRNVCGYGEMYFNARSNARRSKWYKDQQKAKMFAHREEAEEEKSRWIGGNEWEVLQVA